MCLLRQVSPRERGFIGKNHGDRDRSQALLFDKSAVAYGKDRATASACDPRVRIVRFNLLTGSPVEQHSMEGLTENLRVSAAVRGQALRPVEGYGAAAQCSEHPVQSHT